MKVASLSRIAAQIALLPLLTAFASAQTIMTEDDFQSYSVGAVLPTAAGGTHGAYSYAAANPIYIQADPLDPGNKVVSVSANGGSAYLYANALTGVTKTFDQLAAAGQSLQLSYDIYVSSTNLNMFYASLQYAGSTAFGTLYFKIPNGGNAAVNYLVAGRGETSTGYSISTDTWWTMTYDFYQLEDDSWAFAASMLNKATQESIVLLKDQVASIPDTSVTSFQRLNFYQYNTPTNVNTTYIDNLSLQIIPEPSIFCLLGLTVVGALFAFRRHAQP